MCEPHQPAHDHAEQPQEAARHQKEMHYCQTRTCKQPSSQTQVITKNSFSLLFSLFFIILSPTLSLPAACVSLTVVVTLK